MVGTALATPAAVHESRSDLRSVARRRVQYLVVMALVYLLLLVMLGTLSANYPQGHNTPYGLTRNLWAHYRPSWGYPSLVIPPDVFSALFLTVLISLWVLYAVVARNAARASQTDRGAFIGIIAAGAIAFNALLAVWFPPVLSSDIFSYTMHGRLLLSGQNPYAEGASVTEDPPFGDLTPWRTTGAEYGPAWAWFSAALATVAKSGVVASSLCYRGFSAASNLTSALLVYRITKRSGRNSALALALYGWNPLLLVELAGGGHNDCIMIALALLGVYLSMAGNRTAASGAMMLSALVKYMTGLLLLLYSVWWLAKAARRTTFLARCVSLTLCCGTVVAVIAFPFTKDLGSIADLIPGLLATESPNVSLIRATLEQGMRVLSHNSAETAGVLRYGLHSVYGVVLMVILCRIARGSLVQQDLVRWFGWLSLGYVVLIHKAMFPWYLAVPTAMASLTHDDRGTNRLLVYTAAAGIMYLLPYGVVISE